MKHTQELEYMYSINTSSYTSYYISWQSFAILRSIYLLIKSTRSIVFYLTFFTIYILFQKFKFIQVFLKLFFANFFLTIINSSNIRKKTNSWNLSRKSEINNGLKFLSKKKKKITFTLHQITATQFSFSFPFVMMERNHREANNVWP